MILAEEIQSRIKQALPEAEVTVQDMTGGGDHFQVIVISPAFRGKTLIEQHQMIHASLKGLEEAIHALAIKTRVPPQ